jgi:hypothetical protein
VELQVAAQLLPCVDHDPRYPLRRADAREHEAGRHFEQGVAEKEQAATKTVDRGAELQIVVHLKRSKASDCDPWFIRSPGCWTGKALYGPPG